MQMFKFTSYLFIVISITALLLGLIGCRVQEAAKLLPKQERLQVATTTSLYDTGLWSYLEPMFEKQYGVEMDVLYAGTGIALEYGRRGDVDVITVHSKARELQFIEEGYGVERVPFAYNYFLIVGPSNDPAGMKGMSPEDALKKLEQTGTGSFISRGDDSGTHSKEKSLWINAGFDYEEIQQAGEWYIEAGRGMGPTLLMASEKQAYTLSDMGTFLSYKGKIELVPIIDEGSSLLNVYSAVAVSPEKNPKTNYEMANNLINFIISAKIQKLIGDYGIEQYGIPLFIPCAGAEPKS
jgi:tungstate transport system substrate-binding protein